MSGLTGGPCCTSNGRSRLLAVSRWSFANMSNRCASSPRRNGMFSSPRSLRSICSCGPTDDPTHTNKPPSQTPSSLRLRPVNPQRTRNPEILRTRKPRQTRHRHTNRHQPRQALDRPNTDTTRAEPHNTTCTTPPTQPSSHALVELRPRADVAAMTSNTFADEPPLIGSRSARATELGGCGSMGRSAVGRRNRSAAPSGD